MGGGKGGREEKLAGACSIPSSRDLFGLMNKKGRDKRGEDKVGRTEFVACFLTLGLTPARIKERERKKKKGKKSVVFRKRTRPGGGGKAEEKKKEGTMLSSFLPWLKRESRGGKEGKEGKGRKRPADESYPPIFRLTRDLPRHLSYERKKEKKGSKGGGGRKKEEGGECGLSAFLHFLRHLLDAERKNLRGERGKKREGTRVFFCTLSSTGGGKR